MKMNVIDMETDVLIIGGGLAGCMAAIKAAETGQRVTVAEKANTSHSGATGSGIDHITGYCPEIHGKMGWSIDDLVEDHAQSMGFVNRDLAYYVFDNMYDRVLDLEKFGINFRYDDSKLPGKFHLVPQWHSVPTAWYFDGREIKKRLTEEAKRRGVNIINRVMVTDLMATDGQISGALGVGTRSADIYNFKAKAAVLCTGMVERHNRQSVGIDFDRRSSTQTTGDGRKMSLDAGIALVNMEFLSSVRYAVKNYHQNGGPSAGRDSWYPASDIIDHTGKVIRGRSYWFDWDKHFKEGIDAVETRRNWLKEMPGTDLSASVVSVLEEYNQTGPLYAGCSSDATPFEIEFIRWANRHEGKCYHFSTYHLDKEMNYDWAKDRIEIVPRERDMAFSGIVVDKNFETSLKGLFSAGDEIGGVMPGGFAAGAVAGGWHAGDMAAKHARIQTDFLPASEEKLRALEQDCSDMLESKEGYYWKEAELAAQNALDLYRPVICTEPMLKRGIEVLQEIKEAQLRAENPHELMRCLEVKSLIDNNEMIMRASLERRESRNRPLPFRRYDYPEQDDKNYGCFLALHHKDGEYKFSKIFMK